MFEAFARSERRQLLALLDHEADGHITLEQGEPTVTQWIGMYHSHLPKLERLGFIQWDRDVDVISPGPRFEEIRPLLTFLQEQAADS